MTFFLRALIPAGYMPGNLLEGEFVRLCPAGLPAFTRHEVHAGHHDGQAEDGFSADSELSSVCPLGAGFGQAGLLGALPAPVPAMAQANLAVPTSEKFPPAPTGVAFRSRAPPTILV